MKELAEAVDNFIDHGPIDGTWEPGERDYYDALVRDIVRAAIDLVEVVRF